MKRPIFLVLRALATVALAGVTAYLVVAAMPEPEPDHREDAPDFHEWMTARLEITPAQENALAPLEREFTTERERLRRELRAKGRNGWNRWRTGASALLTRAMGASCSRTIREREIPGNFPWGPLPHPVSQA